MSPTFRIAQSAVHRLLSPGFFDSKSQTIGGAFASDGESAPHIAANSSNAEHTLQLPSHSGGALDAHLCTDRLSLRSIKRTSQDLNCIRSVFCDPGAMHYSSHGLAKTEFSARKRWNKWTSLWEAGNPYSGFSVHDRQTNAFIGFIRLSASNEPGIAELTFALLRSSWGRGYGTEAAKAILGVYVPALRQGGYLINGNILGSVAATVHPDNVGSVAVLERSGFDLCASIVKCNQNRLMYCYAVSGRRAYVPDLRGALTTGRAVVCSRPESREEVRQP